MRSRVKADHSAIRVQVLIWQAGVDLASCLGHAVFLPRHTDTENSGDACDVTVMHNMPVRLDRRRSTLQEDLHTLKFVVESALERGIARRFAGHVADIGRELSFTPGKIAPADYLVAP